MTWWNRARTLTVTALFLLGGAAAGLGFALGYGTSATIPAQVRVRQDSPLRYFTICNPDFDGTRCARAQNEEPAEPAEDQEAPLWNYEPEEHQGAGGDQVPESWFFNHYQPHDEQMMEL